MRPAFFDTAEDLINFINNLPTPAGRAKGSDGEFTDAMSVLDKLKRLVPDMFRYREVLVKAPGGLGNLKSLRRFSEVAANLVSEECHEAYEDSLNELAEEIEKLINLGVSEETGSQLAKAKTQLAQFEYMNSSISGFKTKLQKQMARVEDASQGLVSGVTKAAKANKDSSIKDQLNMAIQKLHSDLDEVRDLMAVMDQFCDLQMTYNSIFIGASNAA